ncbi:DNA primase large subunit PriL [Infirmifilum sp. NZ]|uniref:DNA primase large subunit PriL n=1 Tax=Infirmifilum sp. NZ TaxID=2926850 RepID=UPI00279DA6C5|nr:DNA primase large subunit PriL [Infirmifilum sp. NZ]UNQ72786.1 DNA primase large subunit PriL [Infirmifilum sp. NZ]
MPEALRVALSTDDYRWYPFLPEALRVVQELGLTLEELGETPLGLEILEAAKSRVLTVIESGAYPPPSDDYRLEVSVFTTALLILSQVGDRALTEKFAVAFSKRVFESIERDSSKRPELLLYLATVFGWSFRVEGGGVSVHFKDYVYAQPEFTGPWKLVNRQVSGGYVWVTWREFARLLQTGVKKHVARLVDSAGVDPSAVPERLYAAVEEVSRRWAEARSEVLAYARAGYRKGDASVFPPCIRALLEEIQSGKNLTHSARFALASFLLSIGFSVDETLEVFKASPDYREDLARYQVEHIAGLRGSRTKYTPYKCDNMRSLGLCRWSCQGVKHPLQFFYRAVRGRPPRVT